MTDTKSTPAKTSAKGKAEPKTKRAPRSLEERIAELQAQAEARQAKAKEKAELEYREVVGKFERAVAQATKFADQLRQLSAAHGFDLPAGVEPPTAGEVEAAQVEVAKAAESTDSDA